VAVDWTISLSFGVTRENYEGLETGIWHGNRLYRVKPVLYVTWNNGNMSLAENLSSPENPYFKHLYIYIYIYNFISVRPLGQSGTNQSPVR
jgi:hypothetical protein